MLTKVTTAAAIVFMFTSLGLSFFFGQGAGTSVMEDVKQQDVPVAESPAAPVQPAEGEQK